MRFSDGWLQIGRWQGAAVRLHWTVPLGSVVFGGFKFVPVFWLLFPVLVLVHEFGHAWLVRRARCEVISIDAHAAGGQCQWRGDPTEFQIAVIAWGGVLAQALLLAGVLGVEELFDIGWSPVAEQVHRALVIANMVIIVLNLLPIPPLDGAEAWRIVPMLPSRVVTWLRHARLRTRASRLTRPPQRRHVLEFGASAPAPASEAQRLMEEVRIAARARDSRRTVGSGDPMADPGHTPPENPSGKR